MSLTQRLGKGGCYAKVSLEADQKSQQSTGVGLQERPLKNVSRCSGIQVQGQFRRKAELDSRQAARKGDPAVLRESQREDLALTLHCVQPQEYIEYFED